MDSRADSYISLYPTLRLLPLLALSSVFERLARAYALRHVE